MARRQGFSWSPIRGGREPYPRNVQRPTLFSVCSFGGKPKNKSKVNADPFFSRGSTSYPERRPVQGVRNLKGALQRLSLPRVGLQKKWLYGRSRFGCGFGGFHRFFPLLVQFISRQSCCTLLIFCPMRNTDMASPKSPKPGLRGNLVRNPRHRA